MGNSYMKLLLVGTNHIDKFLDTLLHSQAYTHGTLYTIPTLGPNISFLSPTCFPPFNEFSISDFLAKPIVPSWLLPHKCNNPTCSCCLPTYAQISSAF